MAESARLADLRRVERDHARAAAERNARVRQRDRAATTLETARDELAGVLKEIDLPAGLSAAHLATWLRAHEVAVMACREADLAKATLEDAEAKALAVSKALANGSGRRPRGSAAAIRTGSLQVDRGFYLKLNSASLDKPNVLQFIEFVLSGLAGATHDEHQHSLPGT